VKVAAGLHTPVGQDHRVIDGRGELGVGDAARVGERVTGGARNLGRAAQRIGVLHPGIAVTVACDDLRAVKQSAQISGAVGLAGMGAQRDQLLRKGPVGTKQCLD
jgi:hypothetical protein